MLQFVSQAQRGPARRAAAERIADFREVYERFSTENARAQSARCSQCGIPFCQHGCPLGNDIPDWLRLAAEGRLEEAYAVSAATNNMPEVCGRICPQDRLCEGVCVIEQSGHGTVTIGAVEQFITDAAWDEGWVRPIAPKRERSQSVGIVGAGPAGLAAAEQLREQGFQVTVYDRHDRAGGLLIYGIPNFKLEKRIVTRRVERLARSGVAFELSFEVGRDASLEDLRERHDAVLIACGVYKARDLVCPGVGNRGVEAALDYLTASNRKGLGDDVPGFQSGRLDARGKRVAVIGGGDTAMDCVRTAVRQGARSVVCLYRRDRANMPGSLREVARAEEEGVRFEWLSGPRALLGNASAVSGVRAVRMTLGAADATGRLAPVDIAGSAFDLAADLVIKALGFDPEPVESMLSAELAVTKRGAIKVNPATFETSLEGVYAAGDVVRGASLVVWAIHDGRKAAAAIHSYLEKQACASPSLARGA